MMLAASQFWAYFVHLLLYFVIAVYIFEYFYLNCYIVVIYGRILFSLVETPVPLTLQGSRSCTAADVFRLDVFQLYRFRQSSLN